MSTFMPFIEEQDTGITEHTAYLKMEISNKSVISSKRLDSLGQHSHNT
jgi:hypothetical protein